MAILYYSIYTHKHYYLHTKSDDVARAAPEFALMVFVLAVATPLRLIVGAHPAPEFSDVGEEYLYHRRAVKLLHSGKLAADPLFAGVSTAQKVDLGAFLVRGDERQAEW